MTIKSKREMRSGIEIDLTGPEGNAFALMGFAKKFSTIVLEIDPDPIIEDMMSSDYEHLLEVFEKHFGEFVTLYR